MSSFKAKKKRIRTAVRKATRSYPKPPKDKHVRSIVLSTFNRDESIQVIVRGLVKRLDKRNWIVVLKALQIFHLCYRDGDQQFIDSLKPRSTSIFSLRRFNTSDLKGHVITVFIRKYAKYLEEKVSVLRLLGFQFEKQPNATKKLKLEVAFKRIPKLQSQLNALLNCKIRSAHITQNTLIVTTYVLLLKDSLILYQALNIGIVGLLDRFHTMGKKNAEKTLEIYKLFLRETDALIALYEVGRSITRNLPDIKKPKEMTVETMEKHIKKLEKKGDSDENDEDEDAIEAAGIEIPGEDMEDSIEGDLDEVDMKGGEEDSESDEDSGSTADDSGSVPHSEPLPEETKKKAKGDKKKAKHKKESKKMVLNEQQPTQIPSFFEASPIQQMPVATFSQAPVEQQIEFDPFGGGEILQPSVVDYQKKADDIKNLATTLYSTTFDNFGNVFANQVNPQNPFDQTVRTANYQPTSNGFPTQTVFATSPSGVSTITGVFNNPTAYNSNPTPNTGFGQQAVGNAFVQSQGGFANPFGQSVVLQPQQTLPINTNPFLL